MGSPTYLKQRRRGWYVQLAVPKHLQESMGRKVLTRSLQTRDRAEAMRRRHRVIAELQDLIAGTPEVPASGTPEALLAQALHYRKEIEAGTLDTHDAEASLDHSLDQLLSKEAKVLGIDAEGHPLLPPEAESTIRRATKALSGSLEGTLGYQLQAHLTEAAKRLTAQTMAEKTKRLEAFCAWFGDDNDCTDVSRQVAGRYVSEVIRQRTHGGTGKPLSAATMRKEVSDLRAWFDELLIHGVVELNPFDRMSSHIKESTRGKAPPRRPWTSEELSTVLRSVKPEDALWSLTALAAYTGMRREEIGELRVSSVEGDVLKVEQGKTAAAVRRVPVHPAIAPLVASLAATSSDGYLIPGLLRGGPDQKRSWYVGKRFGRVIRDLGITDKQLNFHALRSTLITAMEGAGVAESTMQLIVGHKRSGMTLGTYSAGVPDAVKREAILKVSYGRLDDFVRATGAGVVVKPSARARKRS